MTTRTALHDLQIFIQNPTFHSASQLVSIPALYNLLKYEEGKGLGHYPASVILLCAWVHERGKMVLDKLLVHQPLSEMECSVDNTKSWKTVGKLHNLQWNNY
jgi:hypothetical protein